MGARSDVCHCTDPKNFAPKSRKKREKKLRRLRLSDEIAPLSRKRKSPLRKKKMGELVVLWKRFFGHDDTSIDVFEDPPLEACFDELPCEKCTAPTDLKHAKPGDYHCHICHLQGTSWNLIEDTDTLGLSWLRDSNNNSICMHLLCMMAWTAKCELDRAGDIDVCVFTEAYYMRPDSQSVFLALQRRMLGYGITLKEYRFMQRPIFVSDEPHAKLKLKKHHAVPDSAG